MKLLSFGAILAETDDSYSANNVEVMDMGDYSVSSVQKDPRDFCEYKDAIVEALDCMTKDMVAKCPYLPEEMTSKSRRMKQAFDNFCAEIDDVDPVCMTSHWETTMACHDVIMMQKKKRRPSRPESDSEPEAEYSKWGSKDDDDDDEDKSSRPMRDRKKWNKIICRMKYLMMECVSNKMKSCHAKTAELMTKFMKDMSSPNCTAMMNSWDAQQNGASSVSVAWATVLSSAFLLVLYPF